MKKDTNEQLHLVLSAATMAALITTVRSFHRGSYDPLLSCLLFQLGGVVGAVI